MTATELLMSKDFEGQNRGFGFVEFYNHGAANAAKKTLSSPTFKYCPAVCPAFQSQAGLPAAAAFHTLQQTQHRGSAGLLADIPWWLAGWESGC